jgi:hypothetical protein
MITTNILETQENALKSLFTGFCIFLFTSCSLSLNTSNQNVAFLSGKRNTTTQYENLGSCRSNVIKSTCLVKKGSQFNRESKLQHYKNYLNSTCENGTKVYAKKILELYDSLPKPAQSAFCYIKKIFIVSGDVSYGAKALSAYDLRNLIYDKNKPDKVGLRQNGFILEISQKHRLENYERIDEMFNRHNHRRFGIKLSKASKYHPAIPKAKYKGDDMRSSLYYSVIHEIGHFLEDSTSSAVSHNYKDKILTITSNWTTQDWDAEWNPKWNFPKFSIKKYSLLAKDKNEVASADNVFTTLLSSPFISFYSLVNPSEDFADFYTHFLLKGRIEYYDQNKMQLLESRPENFHRREKLMKAYIKKGFSSIESSNNIRWIRK